VNVINVDSLVPGQITEGDYYSVQGELLISRGIRLSLQLITALKRRNIYELQIINTYIESSPVRSKASHSKNKIHEESKPRAASFFSDIDEGEPGLAQLLHLHSVTNLDKSFRFGRLNDRPIGAALKLRMKTDVPVKPFRYL
jgi:hypothetical protein